MRRRDFLLGSAAGVSGLCASARAGEALGAPASARGRREGRAAYGARAYSQTIVIDAQAVIPDPDPNVVLESAPSQRLLSDLQASGLTAVSMTLNVGSTGDRMVKAIRKIATFDEKVAAAPERLARIRTGADLRNAKGSGRLGLIYNLQDSSLLENDLTRVNLLQQLGVRIMQLTYNTRNQIGDGCLEQDNSGLSNLGHQLVAEMARVRMLMDLSHSGQRTIAEAIAEAKAP